VTEVSDAVGASSTIVIFGEFRFRWERRRRGKDEIGSIRWMRVWVLGVLRFCFMAQNVKKWNEKWKNGKCLQINKENVFFLVRRKC
jgi:hypothetical protein